MLEIFKRAGAEPGTTKAAQAAEAVGRLEVSRQRAQAVFDKAQQDYEQAALDGAETSDGEKALEIARQNVVREERRLIESDLALQGARKRHSAALAADERAALAGRWDSVAALAARRTKAISNFDQQADKLGAAYREVIDSTNDLNIAMPANSRPDLVTAVLGSEHVVPALRLRLRKAGLPWAHNWPDGVDMIPNVAQQLKDDTRAVANLKPEGI